MARSSPAAPVVSHDEAQGRFHATVDGEYCRLDYRLEDGSMTIVHTRVPPAVEGRGIAAALSRAALEHARRQGWKVVPQCAYAAAFMRRHPDFDDLRE